MTIENWYKLTERPEERRLRRKIRRAAIMEAVGGFVMAGMSVLLFWLYLAVTPQQSSAINDLEEVGEQQAYDSKERAP